jgi:hypothetical protein
MFTAKPGRRMKESCGVRLTDDHLLGWWLHASEPGRPAGQMHL